MIAAYLMQTYWALVVGTSAGRLIGTLISYCMHAMRPRLSFVKFREIFAISQWMLVSSAGQYLDGSLHKILVGRRADSAVLGGYTPWQVKFRPCPLRNCSHPSTVRFTRLLSLHGKTFPN